MPPGPPYAPSFKVPEATYGTKIREQVMSNEESSSVYLARANGQCVQNLSAGIVHL